MPIVEIEPAHADWIIGVKIGQHIYPTVCSDSHVNVSGLSESEITQDILSARGVAK